MLSHEEKQRYGRQLVIPEVGEEGQKKLSQARVLIVGAGGLGSPASYYLAAAGVGTLALMDEDRVELSNLQRQILHGTSSLGEPKVQSGRQTLEDLNPGLKIVPLQERLDPHNTEEIIRNYDIVVDGCDNFRTRYIINDACVLLRKPYVFGSVLRFEGQASVFHSPHTGCYRCLFREPPAPNNLPDPSEAGVLGTTPGIIGVIEAMEAIKLVLGAGDSLFNRLLIYDGLRMSFMEVDYYRDPSCPVCGDSPSITSLKEANYSMEV